jgi:hypothetical protein
MNASLATQFARMKRGQQEYFPGRFITMIHTTALCRFRILICTLENQAGAAEMNQPSQGGLFRHEQDVRKRIFVIIAKPPTTPWTWTVLAWALTTLPSCMKTGMRLLKDYIFVYLFYAFTQDANGLQDTSQKMNASQLADAQRRVRAWVKTDEPPTTALPMPNPTASAR